MNIINYYFYILWGASQEISLVTHKKVRHQSKTKPRTASLLLLTSVNRKYTQSVGPAAAASSDQLETDHI